MPKKTTKTKAPAKKAVKAKAKVIAYPKAYKAFNAKLQCRNFQYKIGEEFTHSGVLEMCGSGFHACPKLPDCFEYYPSRSEGTRIAEVELRGEVKTDGNKVVTNKIFIVRELSSDEISVLSNAGDSNAGHSNAGHWNAGDSNAGHSNAGHSNAGHWNAGDSNAGHSNAGHWNAGDSNAGHSNAGHWNAGHSNAGHWNAGHSNAGHSNAGHWNAGHSNAGCFNTLTPDTISIFDKPCSREIWDNAYKPGFLYFDIRVWVASYEMTEEEKTKHPEHCVTGGIIRKRDYKEAFKKSWESASKSDRMRVKDLPNFDEEKFFEISSIRVSDYK